MEVIGNDENNAAQPVAGGEPQFMQGLLGNLSYKLYEVGFPTSATAVGGLVEQLVAAASGSGSARSTRQSQLLLLLLLVILFGGLGTIYAGYRLEVAPTPRWRKAGVAIYFFCSVLLVAAVSLVGSDYGDLALNLIRN